MSVTIETPRAPQGVRRHRRFNIEKWGWIYMRASGVVLVVLIFGHLFVNLVAGEGVKAIDFGFVGGKLSQPFWQIWDTLLLWLALIHGANGMRTIVNDYANNRTLRIIFKGALLAATIVLILLGTLVIYTFDPCPAGAPADLLPSFCPAN
ncbi:succinate dehydrogenase hydrophobic membrane anchor subunit [Lacisediminihabitans changchengi]|uniref:Succinate dehydrogenase hydrophobic membrane anchor subunit n=1 Tax=Lacisediminihabitans changchengi TaxID=2787634 RepID=A0A934W517_9MICO|nr:succinate dehydrogenase hydrophobic membrane anchor subunit [Lacisediminihabitans changchengi]MBK4348859.1 succinate dehydrogenase hydrophobic membrane anchor subunit [Lacisediminihabitans changchengi]